MFVSTQFNIIVLRSKDTAGPSLHVSRLVIDASICGFKRAWRSDWLNNMLILSYFHIYIIDLYRCGPNFGLFKWCLFVFVLLRWPGKNMGSQTEVLIKLLSTITLVCSPLFVANWCGPTVSQRREKDETRGAACWPMICLYPFASAQYISVWQYRTPRQMLRIGARWERVMGKEKQRHVVLVVAKLKVDFFANSNSCNLPYVFNILHLSGSLDQMLCLRRLWWYPPCARRKSRPLWTVCPPVLNTSTLDKLYVIFIIGKLNAIALW